MDYKIIKKFLPKKYFISLKETLHSIHFPWYYRPRMTKDSSGLFFTHSFFTGNKFNSDYFDLSVLYNELKVSRLDEVRASGTNKSQAKNPANINFFFIISSPILDQSKR